MTLGEVLGLDRWVESATEAERESRIARVREHLFPAGLDAAEVARRRELLELADEVDDETRLTYVPTPLPDLPLPAVVPAAPSLPPLPVRKPSRFYRSTEFDAERAEMRAEQDEMMKEATDPFYDAAAARRAKKAAEKPAPNALAQLGRERRKNRAKEGR